MEPRISFVTGFFLIATALVFDGIGLIAALVPGVGTVVAVFAYVLFFVWFALLGVRFMSGEKALQKGGTFAVSFIMEMIPFLGALPAITASVVIIIVITYAEDKREALRRAAKLRAQTRPRRDGRRPANNNAPSAANDNEEPEEESRAA